MNFKKEKRILFLAALSALAAAIVLALAVGIAFSRRGAVIVDDNVYEGKSKRAERKNFLLLGRDRVSGLSDVMMLVSLDADAGELNVLQIPRDTYAEYTASGYRKINGALSALGADGVCEFFERSLCVDIDGYAVFDLDVFADVVDMIGGVEIDIPFDMEYRDPYQDLYISIPAGKQTLSGERAEQFVRYRFGYVRGDLGRIDAQKLFMSAFFKKVSEDLSRAELLRIATSLISKIDTNISLGDAISLAANALSIDAERVNMLTLSGEDIRSDVSGAWFYVISNSAVREQVATYMGADINADAFDAGGAFLNEASDKFAAIYNTYLPYSVSNVGELNTNGIDIEKR